VAKTRYSGPAGEFFVAGELSARGWIASITPRGIERTDVLAQHGSGGRMVAIQAKASVQRDFPLSGAKPDDYGTPAGDEIPTARDNEWFIFVGLNKLGARPDFYIVPRNVVAGAIWTLHRVWHRGDSKFFPGTLPRRGGKFRRLTRSDLEGYRETWELLEEPTTSVPLLLPSRIIEMSALVPLPPSHPGW
jgi:hypothetical protein